MKKLNQSGFSPVIVLLALILAVLVGFTGYYVYSSQKKDNSQTAQTPAPASTTATTDINSSKVQESAKDSGIGFLYTLPTNWATTEGTTNNKKSITLKTSDLVTVTNKLGATLVTTGAEAVIYTDSLNGKTLEQYYNQGFIETILTNKNVVVKEVSYGQNKGVQFTYGYEGSASTNTYLLLDNNKVLVASYTSKDNSTTDQLFSEYAKILESIKQ